MIGLSPAIETLKRPAGMTYSPESQEELDSFRALVQMHRDALPIQDTTSNTRSGRAIGNHVLSMLDTLIPQDSKKGSPTQSRGLLHDEAQFVQAAARSAIDHKPYESLVAQILAIDLGANIQREAA